MNQVLLQHYDNSLNWKLLSRRVSRRGMYDEEGMTVSSCGGPSLLSFTDLLGEQFAANLAWLHILKLQVNVISKNPNSCHKSYTE